MYFSSKDNIGQILSTVESLIRVTDNRNGIDIEVKPHSVKRSNLQNNFYWLNATSISSLLNESGLTYGEYKIPYTAELVHEITKKKIGVLSTRKLTVPEFCEFMTKFFAFWIEKTSGCWQPKESPIGYLERTGLV